MKLITYNIRKGKGPNGRDAVDMERIGAAVRDQSADLLLCQEVFHCARTGASQSGGLADVLGFTSYYGANKYRSVGHHGNTTLTSLPVEHYENHDISTNRIERRGALYLRTHFEGKPLHVFNVHLGLNGFQRSTQLTRISKLIEQLAEPDEPVILAGDFNDWRQQLEQRISRELGLNNAVATELAAAPKTWHAQRPMLPLDRIYLRHLRAHSAGCLDGEPWSTLSDHLPLFAELEPAW